MGGLYVALVAVVKDAGRASGLQEVIAFTVFCAFAFFWLGEAPQVRYVVAMGLMVAAMTIAFV